MNSKTIIKDALGREGATRYHRLKQKFDRFGINTTETSELNRLRRQVAKYIEHQKSDTQTDKRMKGFVKEVNQLLEEGVKRTVLLRAVREATGHSQANHVKHKDPIAIFPEIQVTDSNGQKQAFVYYAGKRYGVRGELAEAYAQMKKHGLTFFNDHLTPFGRQWLTEVEMIGGHRGRNSGQKFPRKVNLIKIQSLFENK